MMEILIGSTATKNRLVKGYTCYQVKDYPEGVVDLLFPEQGVDLLTKLIANFNVARTAQVSSLFTTNPFGPLQQGVE